MATALYVRAHLAAHRKSRRQVSHVLALGLFRYGILGAKGRERVELGIAQESVYGDSHLSADRYCARARELAYTEVYITSVGGVCLNARK